MGEGRIIVGTLKGEVIALEPSGKPLWTAQVAGEVLAPATLTTNSVLVRTADGRIFSFGIADGKRKWVYQRATPPLLLRGDAGVVATANNVLTCEINGTAVTHPTWVQAFTSSAVGDVSEVIPTAANAVNAGDKIEFISSGAGDTNTVPTSFYADILVG